MLLLAILVFPEIQKKFDLFRISSLKGAITKTPDSSFTVQGWFSCNYQNQKEKYLNEAFGFRNLFVRMNNEQVFYLFNQALAKGVIIGKENYLYEENYIKAYYGLDFIGKDSISSRMQKLKYIQDTLVKLHKTLILVFAPSKGTFYPEYFPDKYKTTRGPTNYEYYVEDAKKLGINHIDFNKYFIENKYKSKYPLYSKYGIHWSFYGECLAADSLIKYIEEKRKIIMPHIFWNDIDMDFPRERDADIEDGMNLMFTLKSNKLAYPRIQFQSDSGKTKPSSIIIADSYYWGMFNFGISRVFSDSHFWFYNNEIYPENYTNGLTVQQINLKEQIDEHDVIIIMATDATLPNLGWGFIENTYKVFKGINLLSSTDPEYIKRINNIRSAIKADKVWLSSIEKQANKNGISVDSCITLNAIWFIEHEKKSN